MIKESQKIQELLNKKIALKKLVNDICNRYNIKDIAGHNDYSNKACPCFNVRSEFSLDSDDN